MTTQTFQDRQSRADIAVQIDQRASTTQSTNILQAHDKRSNVKQKLVNQAPSANEWSLQDRIFESPFIMIYRGPDTRPYYIDRLNMVLSSQESNQTNKDIITRPYRVGRQFMIQVGYVKCQKKRIAGVELEQILPTTAILFAMLDGIVVWKSIRTTKKRTVMKSFKSAEYRIHKALE